MTEEQGGFTVEGRTLSYDSVVVFDFDFDVVGHPTLSDGTVLKV